MNDGFGGLVPLHAGPGQSMNLRRIRSVAPLTAISAFVSATSPALADYPIASHRYLADPAALVQDGRVYLYSSNDDDNAEEGGYSMHSIVCISSRDMKNWTDHGIVFQVPANASWAQNSWAPQPAERDGTVYLYFGNSGSGIGVAKSTSPTGPFVDARGSVLIDGNTPGAAGANSWLFDPGILIDDDGQAYLAFGGNGENNARMIELGSDLTSVSGSAAPFAPPGFYEAAFLFKRNDLYYFAYSTNPANGLRIDYMTSSSPMSGYTYRGVIADQPPENGDNNHASQFELNGHWYHAYHNRQIAIATGTPKTYKRNLAIEALNFNPDGTIQEISYHATDGFPQDGWLDPYARVEAETMNAQRGIETEPSVDGGLNLTAIQAGDWVSVVGVDFGAGATEFSARVASSTDGGSIEIRIDQPDGAIVGTCAVPNTGGPQSWETTTCDTVVASASGVKDLYLKFVGGSFNVDSWQFTPLDGGAGGTGGAGAGGMSTAGAGGTTSAGSEAGAGGVTNAGGAGAANGGTTSAGTAGKSGGSAGVGGSTGGGPSAGVGGAPVGTSGTGGTSAGGVASGGVPSGSAGSSAESVGDDGCGCRVAGSSKPSSLFALLALAALAGARRVRRRLG